jgi:citrate synthase
MSTETAIAHGLDNIVVASTRLSAIDGANGDLRYLGYSVHDLVGRVTFEEIVALLWYGELPNTAQLQALQRDLAAARALTAAEAALLQHAPLSGHGMDALRTLASALALLDPAAADLSLAGAERIGIRLLAKLPTLIAAWQRLRHGLQPVAPEPTLGHAANFLYMLRGETPSASAVRAFDTYLVLLAEHGLNASTFAARVAIGAQADIYCAFVAALGTLKGLVHGGANQKAMETFLEIGSPERAADYIMRLLQQRGVLMGVGHRIYKVEDPRVRHLRRQVAALSDKAGHWPAVADAVAQVVMTHPYFVERRLAPNVEFYSAPLLYTLGLPLDLFTCAFALSRSAGWIGHIREQIAENRLIRPKAEYCGPAQRDFVALEQRA